MTNQGPGELDTARKRYLEVEGVSKDFEGRNAVSNVDLDIAENEIVTLLGPSGCGKTTTLRMIIGLESVTAGRIVYGDRILDDGMGRFVPIHKRGMGIVFQNYAVWPHMTVSENVEYPLLVRKVKPASRQAKVEDVLSLVGMSEMKDRPATALSGGQQQRVALARALVMEPDLLLLDEPLSNLDAKLRQEMRDELKLMQRKLGISMLFVTHDQNEALSMSDRIVVMNDGRVEQTGTPLEVYNKPVTRHVQDFLGDSVSFPGVIAERRGNHIAIRVRGVGQSSQVLWAESGEAEFEPGRSCELCVRPEWLTVYRAEAKGGQEGIVGFIEASLFLGDRVQLLVDVGEGRVIKTFVHVALGWKLDIGEEVVVQIPEGGGLLWIPEWRTCQ